MKPNRILAAGAGLLLVALCASPQANAQFTGKDVGTPALPGSATAGPNGTTTIVGGGSDIWGTSDNCFFYYKTVSSPVWEAVVQVQGLEGPDAWTKCELMVRVPDATGLPQGPDPFIAMMTTRTNGQDTTTGQTVGQNQVGPQWRVSRGGNADQNTMGLAIHPSYKPNPSTWLRLQRTGSMFTLSYSSDGATWTNYVDIDTLNGTPVGTDSSTRFTTPLPDNVLVGVAVTAHLDTDLTGGVAAISDLKVTETPVVGVLATTTQVKDASATAGTEITFSYAATNTAIANGYVGAYQWYKNDQILTNATGPQLTFLAGASDNGAKVYCKASSAGASINSATGTVTVVTGVINAGAVKQELFWNATREQVAGGNVGLASTISGLTSFSNPGGIGNNYVTRLSGLFKAPVTGNYVFFVAADDDTDVSLSSDANPANKRMICQEAVWSGVNAWIGTDTQKSSSTWLNANNDQPWFDGIPLTAGQNYYIEAVHHQGGGGDNLAVTYKLFADEDPTNGAPTLLTSDVLSYFTWAATNLTITTQPQDLTVYEAMLVTLSVTTTTDSELVPNYQWQRNGTDIAGATKSTYSIQSADLADNGAKFKCNIVIPGTSLTATSTEITLTVNPSPFISGLIKKEMWGPGQTAVTRAIIEAGTAPAPTSTAFINSFQNNDGSTDYVLKLSTWFVPSTSGNYVFFLAADDDTDLFLSTDDKPANKRLIAQETGWSGALSWITVGGGSTLEQKRSDSFVDPTTQATPGAGGIALVAGNKYYIEGIQHQGGGGGNLAATFKLIADADPANGDNSKLAGNVVGVKAPAPTTLSITNQPADVTSHGWEWVTFNVAASSDAIYPPTYQWRKNGTAIPGASKSYYSLMTGTNDNGTKYDCVVSLAAYPTPATSSQATLTVNGDAVFTAGQLNEMRFAAAGDRPTVEAGNVGQPTTTGTLTAFSCGVGVADNYVRIVSGIFVPPTTGDYTFFVNSDDDTDLFVSTDNQPVNKRVVCQQQSWADPLQWAGGGGSLTMKRSDQWSPDGGATVPYALGIAMVAGKHYYIEAVHNEGGGGDNLAATYIIVGSPDPANGDPSALTGSVIGTMGVAGAPALTLTKEGSAWKITYDGTLVSSDTAGGTYTAVQGATSPYTVDTTGTAKFFRSVR